jgi:hypothetical protein
VGPGLLLRPRPQHDIGLGHRRTLAGDRQRAHGAGLGQDLVRAVLVASMADHDHLVCRLDAFEQGQVVSIDRRRPDRSAGQQAHPSRRDATLCSEVPIPLNTSGLAGSSLGTSGPASSASIAAGWEATCRS